MSKARLERLKTATKRGQMPTSQGNRKADTRSPGILATANKFYKHTNAAAEALKKKKPRIEDYE